jgi:tetratricopeptide (TPR) repeat protein
MKAETFFSFADYDNATKAWEKVNFSRLPEDLQGPAFFKSGWSLVENGDYNSAIGILSEFISRYPDSPDLLTAVAKRAESYLEVGDRISALSDCERILTEKPQTPLAAFALQLSGRLYHMERNIDKMLASYQTLLAEYNNLSQDTIARANYTMGLGYFDQGDFETALVHLQKARGTAPEFYEESAGTAIALCYYRLKDAEALRETVSRLFAQNPRKVMPRRLLTWLGLQMYEQSNFQAANLYLSIIAKDAAAGETDEGIWKALAKSRLEIPGREEDALSAIEIVLNTEEDPFWRSDALLDKANALIKLERWNDAEIAASRGLDLDPQGSVKAGLHLALGDIAMAYGNYSPAASSYVRAAEFFFNDTNVQPLALHKAAWCLEKAGDTSAARAFRDRLRLNHPNWEAPASFEITPGSARREEAVAPQSQEPVPEKPSFPDSTTLPADISTTD